jgi:hypothetical protein
METGSRVSHYEVLVLRGKGGMAQLHRDVDVTRRSIERDRVKDSP